MHPMVSWLCEEFIAALTGVFVFHLQLFVASAIVESQEPGAVLQPAVYVNSDSSGFYVFYATEGGQDMARLVV